MEIADTAMSLAVSPANAHPCITGGAECDP